MAKFKLGDRVRLISCTEWMANNYGLHDGIHGVVDQDDSRVPFVAWDNGRRTAASEERLSLVQAAPSTADRLKAIEDRLAALEAAKAEAHKDTPEYKFGDPVEVLHNGGWRDGVITSTMSKVNGEWWAYYVDDEAPDGAMGSYFGPSHIRPRTT